VCGRLLLKFASNWHIVTELPWILEIVRSGYRIEFAVQTTLPPPCAMDREKSAIDDLVICNLLKKGAIVKAIRSYGAYK